MEVLAQAAMPPYVKRQRKLGASGVVLGLAAMVMAVCGPAFIEAKDVPAPDLPNVLAESANRIKDHLAHKEIQVEPERRISWETTLVLGGAFIGFLAAALGTASWVRRENSRLSSVAIATGLTAIAWNYFVFAAISAVGLFLMAWVVSHFHVQTPSSYPDIRI
jgi:hypothetical protein